MEGVLGSGRGCAGFALLRDDGAAGVGSGVHCGRGWVDGYLSCSLVFRDGLEPGSGAFGLKSRE